jgi:glycosyltransferase involved in cell wall biosynthesis
VVQRPALDAVNCFHATAESEYADVRRLGFRQPVAVIPNGIDILELMPKTPTDSRTLLFLGRIHPNKGLDMLLPAWRAVQDRFNDWKLRIVGPDDGGYLGQMRKLANDLALERIEFVEPLYGNMKRQAYAEADLFVLPSYSENFGMAIAEALAAGTPVIVAKGAPWGGIETHQTGWWIDIGIDPLIASLEEAFARTPAQLQAMGMRGRAWMEKEFSWVKVGRMMAKTYRWILDGGETPKWVRG